MNMQDPKYHQKSIRLCSPEQNYLFIFAMRYPVYVPDSRKQTNHPYLKLTGPTCQHNIPGQNFWPLTFKGIQTIDITTFHLSHLSASGVAYFGHQEYQLYWLEDQARNYLQKISEKMFLMNSPTSFEHPLFSTTRLLLNTFYGFIVIFKVLRKFRIDFASLWQISQDHTHCEVFLDVEGQTKVVDTKYY